jgi:hypothetical protein
MRMRRALVGAVLAVCAASAPAAQAQAAPGPKRSAPVVVATDGPVKLEASDSDEDLCLTVGSGNASGETCDSAETGAAVVGRTARGTHLLGAAVPAAATTIEVRRAGELLSAGMTVAGEAYTGKRAGTLRFALVRLPKDAREDGLRVRAIAADGTLVGVLSVSSSERDLVSDRHRLLSGRSGAVRWSITSRQTSSLQPSLIDLGHEALARCIQVDVRTARSGSTSETCLGGAPRENIDLLGGTRLRASAEDSCTPDFRLLHGVVDANVQRVVVLLGDGSRRTAPTRPAGDGASLVYALVVSRAAAVRSVTLQLGDAGSKVVRVAAPPLAVLCAQGGSGDFPPAIGGEVSSLTSPFGELPPITPVGPVTTIPGTPGMRVADGPGDSLCVAVADRPFNALGCGVVSPLLSEVLGTYDDLADPHAFAIVLPAVVATLRIAGPGGKGTRDIPMLPGTGYAGPYAGHVRFAAASVADARELSKIEYLDASGKSLHRESYTASPDELAPPKISAPRRVAGRAGGPSLWRSALRLGSETSDCLALTDGPKPVLDDRCQTTRTARSVLLRSDCATHRLTVAVAVEAGTRAFARTGGSRVLPIRLRRGAGLLTLRAASGLKELTFLRKGRRSRMRVDAPAGARQCGWSAAPGGTLG